MKLVIVESPTKAKTLRRYLGEGYSVAASMGHVRDLPKSKLGVNVEHNFLPDYEVPKGKGKVITQLKKKALAAKTVVLATDPDREGEAIAYHLRELLKGSGKKKLSAQAFERVTFHEITKRAILEAMEKPGTINLNLVDAQQARRVLDRLVGYNLSPVLWKKVRRGLSAGRVQSVAVKLLVEREKEIQLFKPQEYWEIKVNLQPQKKTAFWAELVEVAGKRVEIKNQETRIKKQETSDKQISSLHNQDPKKTVWLESKAVVEPIIGDLKKAAYQVETVEKKERMSRPYAPYTTSTLQQAGANVLGWSGKKTMMMAQNLYEAGLITYHRTDSTSISQQAVDKARQVIVDQYGADFLPEKPNFFATKSKNAQEAHEAIRPTHITWQNLEKAKNGFDAQQEKLYRLIWRRFIACQMRPAVYDATTITVTAIPKLSKPHRHEYRLRASGSVMRFEGWRKAYGLNVKVQASNANQAEIPSRLADHNRHTGRDDQTDIKSVSVRSNSKTEEVILPEVVEGEELKYQDLIADQKTTQPPARYNDASLIKELEKRGIGRPSTYAPTISTIIYRGYVERQEKRLVPTAVGITVTEFLDKHFKEIMDYDFTAEMEEDLDRIARSEKEWQKVMQAFYKPFEKQVKQVEDKAKRMKVPVEKTGDKCPDCKEGEVVVRSGRFGKFLSCSRFPECKYTASFTQKLKGFACPECGGDVVLKRTKKGRSFWGCANYPKCDYASWKDPRKNKPSAAS